jgi:ketosteroid isomerase-like protein
MQQRWMKAVLMLGMLVSGAVMTTAQMSEPEPEATGEVTDETTQLVEAFYAAIEAKDAESVEAMLTEDVVVVHPFTFSGATMPEAEFEGREQVMGYVNGLFTSFSQISIADDGSTVFVEAQGDFIAAQGNLPYRNVYVFKLELRDGQISAIREYYNPVIFAMTFGEKLGSAFE